MVQITKRNVELRSEADHTFMRDDGHRYDPAAADSAWAEVTAFLGHVFG